ncbi:MAG TPA: DinB family protein [Terriglobales bacterium]|nr:DinB family protein [Terriglobales bacterium]
MAEDTLNSSFGSHYLDEARRQFRGHKKLAEGALAQLSDEELFRAPDAESNSIAIMMRHISGNQRSRFTDFLTTDGEKPDRNRDQEFENPAQSREALVKVWEKSWAVVFDSLASLTPEDLLKTVTVRGEPLTVLQAINRQVAHYAYHVGQIVFLAKHWKGSEWKSLSIPKGKSNAPEALAAEKNRP